MRRLPDAGRDSLSAKPLEFLHAAESGLVSVIVPTYNRASIIERAICSALSQTYGNLEVVVVDDGSSDDTRAVVERMGPRVRYVHQMNAGVAAARNTAMRHGRGEFFAYLDSDDVWLEWKIEAEVAGLRANPDVGIVWTDMIAVDDEGSMLDARYLRKMYGAHNDVAIELVMRATGVLSDLMPHAPSEVAHAPVLVGDISNEILLGNLLHTPTVLVRRSWVERVGGLDISWGNAGEDYEYYTRLCAEGPAMLIDASSILYRVGAEDQLTRQDKLVDIARNNLRTVRARLADRCGSTTLSRSVIRRRVAQSFEWAGNMEFDAGDRGASAKHLAASIWTQPALDRRVLVLAACALPDPMVRLLKGVKRRISRRHSN
jgi:glycosyltransferase involved in cell wall biosynthesis